MLNCWPTTPTIISPKKRSVSPITFTMQAPICSVWSTRLRARHEHALAEDASKSSATSRPTACRAVACGIPNLRRVSRSAVHVAVALNRGRTLAAQRHPLVRARAISVQPARVNRYGRVEADVGHTCRGQSFLAYRPQPRRHRNRSVPSRSVKAPSIPSLPRRPTSSAGPASPLTSAMKEIKSPYRRERRGGVRGVIAPGTQPAGEAAVLVRSAWLARPLVSVVRWASWWSRNARRRRPGGLRRR